LLLPLSEDGVAIEYVLGAGNYRPPRDDEADPFPDALDLDGRLLLVVHEGRHEAVLTKIGPRDDRSLSGPFTTDSPLEEGVS
jgi:hypothetical protein